MEASENLRITPEKMDYENEKLLKLIFPQGVPGNSFAFFLEILICFYYAISIALISQVLMFQFLPI